MKIAICEDEPTPAKRLVGFIREWEVEKGVFAEILRYEDAETFLQEWKDIKDFDILFLDIKMGETSGMELAAKVRKTDSDVAIVFVTNAMEYMRQGYSVSAMHYLPKPVTKKDCFACLDRANSADRIKKVFWVDDFPKKFKIPHEDIIYIEKALNNAKIVTAEKEQSLRRTVAQLLEELNDERFAQCHKSYVVNMRRIEYLFNDHLIMSNGDRVSLGKNFAKEFQERFYKYSKNVAR
jgi:DNA-binding LytR/AlgR family response regulator